MSLIRSHRRIDPKGSCRTHVYISNINIGKPGCDVKRISFDEYEVKKFLKTSYSEIKETKTCVIKGFENLLDYFLSGSVSGCEGSMDTSVKSSPMYEKIYYLRHGMRHCKFYYRRRESYYIAAIEWNYIMTRALTPIQTDFSDNTMICWPVEVLADMIDF